MQVRGVVAFELDSKHGAIHTSFIGRIAEAPKPTPAGEVEAAAQALFEEARQRARRRRRRRAAVAGAVLLAAGAALLIASGGDEPPEPHAAPAAPVVAAGSVLSARPAMGLACKVPNSIACDRVVFLVSTRRPARAVTVTIGGRSTVLDDLEWSVPWRHGVKRTFSGYLQPAGMLGSGPLAVRPEDGRYRYTGRNVVEARMHLVISYADGSRRATSARVQLLAGWG